MTPITAQKMEMKDSENVSLDVEKPGIAYQFFYIWSDRCCKPSITHFSKNTKFKKVFII